MGRDENRGANREPVKISIHSPRMGRDHTSERVGECSANFNPLSPHGERRAAVWAAERPADISIHSPRMGRDRPCRPERTARSGLFQSTLPAWGETSTGTSTARSGCHFNPLSPHGERPFFFYSDHIITSYFNPLSPHGERHEKPVLKTRYADFNPLSPHGERPSSIVVKVPL